MHGERLTGKRSSLIEQSKSSGHHLILDRLAVVDTATPQNDRSPNHSLTADVAAGLEEDFRPDLTAVTELNISLNQKRLDDGSSVIETGSVDLLHFRALR